MKLNKIFHELIEGRFSRKPTQLKWEETGKSSWPFVTSFSMPIGKTGIAWYPEDKLKKMFSTKLSKLLGANVDLTNADTLWDEQGQRIYFEFTVGSTKYLLRSSGASRSTQYYNLLKSE